MKSFKTLTLLLFVWLVPNKATASHIVGGDITYVCVGADSFLVTLHLFSHCAGVTPPSNATLSIENQCTNQTSSVVMNYVGNTEVSSICAAQMSNTDCNGGTLPGYNMTTFEVMIALPLSSCQDFDLSWSSCCRGPSTNVPTSNQNSIYLKAEMRLGAALCNNSPRFIHNVTPYFCVNQAYDFTWGVAEIDGDSLAFSLVSGLINSTTPLAYGPGYSAAAPMSGMTINPTSGIISFTPTVIGTFIVTVQVDEYRFGNHIGAVRRDIVFTVLNCSTPNAPPSSGTLANFTGSASINGSSIEMCPGDDFCFDVTVSDPDTADVLTLTTDIQNQLPGASVSVTGSNPATLSVCYTAMPNPGVYSICVTAEDNVCPIVGLNYFFLDVTIMDGVSAGPDVSICGGQSTVQLSATGGSGFTWTSISGDPISVGTNFSCNNCANPVASPTQTTTYVVIANTSANCSNTDTVTVTVSPAFSITISASDTILCYGEDAFLNVAIAPTGNYVIDWSLDTYLNDANISNPVTNSLPYGSSYFEVDVSDASGCTQNAGVMVHSSPVEVNPTASATLVCAGTSIALDGGVNTQPGLAFQWQPDTSVNMPNNDVTLAMVYQTTDYWFYAVDTLFGCVDSGFVNVIVPPLPVMNPINGPDTVFVGQATNYLTNQVSTHTYLWGTANGLITNGQGTNSIDVQWQTPGNATVDLTLLDTNSCGLALTIPVFVQMNLGTEEFTSEKAPVLMPNPATSEVQVLIPWEYSGAYEIVLYDMSGRVLKRQQSTQNLLTIERGSLSSGTYLVELRAGDKVWKSRLVFQ